MGEGCDGGGILEAGGGELEGSLSASSEKKYPSDSVGGCTNEESTLESLSETGEYVVGLTSLSSIKGLIS